MACVNATDDSDDNSGRITTANFKNYPMRGHTPTPCFSFNSIKTTNRQLCMNYSIDEIANLQVL